MRIIDANATLGKGDYYGPGLPTTVDEMLREMDHLGIHEALVRDSAGQAGDPNAANARILEKTHNQPRLHPVWMVLPTHTREMLPPKELVAQMREHSVAAAWINYGAYGLPLEDWVVDDLLGPLAEAGAPLFLDPNDVRQGAKADATDWPGVVRLCRAFPDLPVIVAEERIYKTQRTLWAALEACPNLHIDMSALWAGHCLEHTARRFGADRVILGTQLPARAGGVVLMQTTYADLDEDEIALIAGGNIRRLMAWNDSVKPPAEDVEFSQPLDDLHRKARDRADLSGEGFCDCHGHVGLRGQRHLTMVDPEGMLREMDRLGVEKAIVFSWITHGEVALGNDITFDVVKRWPDRFAGFTSLYVQHGEDEARAELERGLEHGMIGVKMLSSIHRYPETGPVVEMACRFAHEHRQFILNHVWGSPETMRGWLEKYPGACYITGHSEARYADLAREFPHLFICSCPFHKYNQTEQYVKMYGADRILFGSDILDLPVSWGLGPVLHARISETDKRLIARENLKRLMETYGKGA